ncbi:MAG: hypothetical protein H0V69_01300 [Acidimicrobiia bacterium]|jgi:hypothetical protein|nr:hypothetical protein [Acidimicrobiia bacterium]
MVTSDEETFGNLDLLDPTRTNHPPAAGSPRYEAILARVTENTEQSPTSGRRPSRQWIGAGAVAAALVVIGLLALRPDARPTAEAAVIDAARSMRQVSSLRATLTIEHDSGDHSDVDITASGDDRRIVQEMLGADGGNQRYRWIVADGIEYSTEYYDDREETTAAPLDPNYALAPFGEASAAVISALVEEADIVEVGDDTLRGVDTVHYRTTVADPRQSALAGLPRAQLGWFDLLFEDDYYRQDVQIDVWVGDNVIHRIRVASERPRAQVFEADFFDFDADITITPPTGPFARPIED